MEQLLKAGTVIWRNGGVKELILVAQETTVYGHGYLWREVTYIVFLRELM